VTAALSIAAQLSVNSATRAATTPPERAFGDDRAPRGAGEERATERPALTLDRLDALVDLMPDRWKAFLLLKTFASLRWGEITALIRNDLDLERRTVRIRRQFLTMPGGLQLGPPKSRAGIRMVSFPAAILPELQHHLDTYSLDGPDGWVFVTGSRGTAETSIAQAAGGRPASRSDCLTSISTTCATRGTRWPLSRVPACGT
jgi:integrase